MADEQVGKAVAVLQAAQKVDDLHLHRHVQCRGRFVQHDEFGTQDHGAGDGDPLTLPAGELMRVAFHHRGVEADLGHDFGHQCAFVAPVFGAVDPQPFGDDLRRGHARAKASVGVLEHDLHVAAQAAQLPGGPAGNVVALKDDPTFGRDQPHDRQRQRGLARPAFADDPQRLPRPDRQGRLVDRVDMAHGLAQQPALDREPDAQRLGPHHLGRGFGDRVGAARRFGGEEFLGIGVLRIGEDRLYRPLFDNLAALHHADPVRDPPHDVEVVGDEQKA